MSGELRNTGLVIPVGEELVIISPEGYLRIGQAHLQSLTMPGQGAVLQSCSMSTQWFTPRSSPNVNRLVHAAFCFLAMDMINVAGAVMATNSNGFGTAEVHGSAPECVLRIAHRYRTESIGDFRCLPAPKTCSTEISRQQVLFYCSTDTPRVRRCPWVSTDGPSPRRLRHGIPPIYMEFYPLSTQMGHHLHGPSLPLSTWNSTHVPPRLSGTRQTPGVLLSYFRARRSDFSPYYKVKVLTF